MNLCCSFYSLWHKYGLATLQAMDRDNNGKLDTSEFRDAMNKLGMEHLTGKTVSTILSAMDIHGPITLEDFLQIVEVPQPTLWLFDARQICTSFPDGQAKLSFP